MNRRTTIFAAALTVASAIFIAPPAGAQQTSTSDSLSTTTIDRVVVLSAEQNPMTSTVGVVSVPIERIRNTPVLLGESDLMKSLQYIAGVQSGSEGKADLSVRGGSPDQNLILLDGNPIYNANHLFGFVSVFNTAALKSVTLYKGGFPARYGGRLSSVIDINTRDGNKERFGGSATLGLLAAKFNVEGPIIKNRTSFTLSGRRSWADLLTGMLTKKEDFGVGMFFYDINAKIHHRISDNTSVSILAYNGRDRLRIVERDMHLNDEFRQDWKWGNTIVAARLNSRLRDDLFLNANLSFNRYRYITSVWNKEEEGAAKSIDYNSGIRDYTATLEMEYKPSPLHYVRLGTQGVYHDFRPETLSFSGGGAIGSTGGRVPAGEMSFYAEDEWSVAPRLTVNGGVRASAFRVHGKTYTGIDPRLAARFSLTDRVSLKAGYTRMTQYIHLLSNNSTMFETELWVPVTGLVKPMSSTQYSAGAYVSFPKVFDLSVEGYYKDMRGVIEYKDGASFTGSSSGWENKVEAGIGRSYGVEVSLERRVGSTTGSLAYTWSKTERRFDGINFGRWFPAKYDRRHSVNLTVAQRLSRKVDLTASWTYTTGDVMSLPLMTLPVDHPFSEEDKYYDYYQLEGRNNYRGPDYHRLDVGFNFHPRKWRSPKRYGEWNLSVYNVYNRRNAFMVFVGETGDRKPQLRKATLFPILPSISYTYNF